MTNPENYTITKDSQVQPIVKKKPEKKPDDKKPDNKKPEKKPDKKPAVKKPDAKKPGSNSSGGTYQAPVNNTKASGKKGYKAGNILPEDKDLDDNRLDEPTGDQDYLADAPTVTENNGYSGKPIRKHAADCIIHWLVLLGALIETLYILIRCVYVRKKRLIESSFIFDRLLLILSIPLAVIAYLWRACVWDLPAICIWLAITIIGLYANKKIFNSNVKRLEKELAEQEQRYLEQMNS